MASAAGAASGGAVVPAQLGFLAIFNPCLGNTDENIDDQIVYYASDTTQSVGKKRRRARGRPTEAISQEERNERLRQIGLAQGMINFSKGFADGASLDAVDTEKSRIVVHEMEPGWWILASINFTKVPLPPRLPVKSAEEQEEKYEFSSREVKPAALLLRDLLRAHSIFLMHHDTSLSALFVRSKRTKFIAVLARYWDLFLSTWNVMLHGNPVRNIFGGINIAASGELGVGVGEEERGSGEREVLEGLVGRIEGLVDLVVSKFGTEEGTDDTKTGYRDRDGDGKLEPRWLGTGEEPAAEDGAIFLGVGALSRKSVRDVTHWMEDLYQWGDHAYGVIESPTSTRRARGKQANKSVDETAKQGKTAQAQAEPQPQPQSQSPVKSSKDDDKARPLSQKPVETEQSHIPQQEYQKLDQPQQQPDAAHTKNADIPDTSAPATETPNASETPKGRGQEPPQSRPEPEPEPEPERNEDGKFDKMLNYMKLGYGSYWTIPGTTSHATTNPPSESTTPTTKASAPSSKPHPRRPKLPQRISSETHGHYLIGLKGSIEDEQAPSGLSDSSSSEVNSRTLLRTINVELEDKPSTRPDTTIVRDFEHPGSVLTQSQIVGNMLPGYNSHDLNKSEKLRVVVYVNRPFVFTFLFQLRTDSLAWDVLYRSLHYQLAPLKKPLLASMNFRPEIGVNGGDGGGGGSSSSPPSSSSIYNLIWDPPLLTVHSTIPNIPETSSSEMWSRTDAVNTHLHLLNIHGVTRSKDADLERTHKTNRGWWIVWTRILEKAAAAAAQQEDGDHSTSSPPSDGASTSGSAQEEKNDEQQQQRVISKEIFLVRRASDHAGFRGISTGDGVRGGADGASKLVQGIGVDTRRYVEELLSFL
ncbi:hypothetical protein QQS21_011694 [Conoideocrella luteorostrata]|uniref:CCZ1/INTU/HSP4 first Longin domain-containing protein n=1 Tax=Conoideocrella luteorostrata TaxID=1105319 RepID=A0AAJ0CEY8_9HYPO|nr:hypothetical protein QQS21_011694 [Conoideocrella luteorostrata]